MAFHDPATSGIPAPPVAFEPCAQYRIPLEGDLLTCRDCGWFISDHEAGVAE